MARERLYRNNAEKQAAYRARHAQRQPVSQRLLANLGQELHGRLAVMADHLARAGKGLGTALDSYNAAMASFESRVLVSARKFKDLGATSQEAEIIELRAIEGGVRRLQGNLLPDSTEG